MKESLARGDRRIVTPAAEKCSGSDTSGGKLIARLNNAIQLAIQRASANQVWQHFQNGNSGAEHMITQDCLA